MARNQHLKGVQLTEAHRDKIRNSKVLQVLMDFVEGKEGVDMAPHRVTAALGLLRKVLPDATETTHKGDPNAPIGFTILSGVPRPE